MQVRQNELSDGAHQCTIIDAHLRNIDGEQFLEFDCGNFTINIPVISKNPQTEEIGRRRLGQLIRSCGLEKVDDPNDFIGRSFMLHKETVYSFK